jgi:hypothetical protein
VARHQFEAYLDKVFGSSDLVSPLPEGRLFSQHSWKQVFLCVMHLVSISVAKFVKTVLTLDRWERPLNLRSYRNSAARPIAPYQQSRKELETVATLMLLPSTSAGPRTTELGPVD